ncbi:hypothetical protein M9Y10_043824 [Tritrichomonas musculus]|uniref:Uncharacterized protein n=1 Tax=Tritrichomonas musculus TaxID=1915356 RepID=A0ABR2K3P3_9EUKA
MTQPFRTPFFSDTEFKNLKEILPYSSSQPAQIENVSNFLERIPAQHFEEAVNRIRLIISSMQKESLTPDDFKDSHSVVEIKLTTPIPGSNVEPSSQQYQTICNGINEQLKQRIAQLQNENEQLKSRLQRQGEQFKQISALADQLINPQSSSTQQAQAQAQAQTPAAPADSPDPDAPIPPPVQPPPPPSKEV